MGAPPPCPACQEQYSALFKKEREVLDAVFDLVSMKDGSVTEFWQRQSKYDLLMRIGREWAQLCKESGQHR
jgi:hypothetical protein